MTLKVTTRESFIGGQAVPKGTIVEYEGDNAGDNLADVGDYEPPKPAIIAAIAPTGPNPVAPQQLPPGSMQTIRGYSGPAGEELRGERTLAASINEGDSNAGEVEMEPVTRITSTDDFDASKTVEGSVDEVEGRLSGLTAEQLDAVAAAETSGKNRAGVANAIEQAHAAL